jgi:hypothetical protein
MLLAMMRYTQYGPYSLSGGGHTVASWPPETRDRACPVLGEVSYVRLRWSPTVEDARFELARRCHQHAFQAG